MAPNMPMEVTDAVDRLQKWEAYERKPVTPNEDIFYVPKEVGGKLAYAMFKEWRDARPEGRRPYNRLRCKEYWIWRLKPFNTPTRNPPELRVKS